MFKDKRFFFRSAFIGLVSGLLIFVVASQSKLLTSINDTSYAEAIAISQPSVVSIQAIAANNAEVSELAPPLSNTNVIRRKVADHARDDNFGSGVIISGDGYIITNHHLIAGRPIIRFQMNNGLIFSASLIGSDPETDIAVLKADVDSLPAIPVDPNQRPQTGDIVLAIGNPYGVGQTVTQGIVSAIGRSRVGINTFENFIQTDAAINPGNSGGALINTQGELIGINSAIFSENGNSTGIGFAIPSDLVFEVMQDIVRYGQVQRGWLGMIVTDKFDGQNNIILIEDFAENSPAKQAGLQTNDIITHINGQKQMDTWHTLHTIARHKPGQEIQLTLIRNNKIMTVMAKTSLRPIK